MPPSTSISSPPFPADAVAFAAESGATDYLISVWEMTRRVYPMARRITPVMEYDPEIAGLRWIVFEVEIGGMTVDQYVDLHWQWSSELFKVCPATHVCCFGLHEDIKDA
jgi:hypothetical protein